jgi:hypothetical protein
MRPVLLLLLFIPFLKARAQHRYDDELQLTETRFALESQIHGLKWGFLHNMDTAALGINNQGFVRLYDVWKDRPDQASFLLQWKPTALWWSEDGLFGLTTGPFFTKAAKDTTALATGFFFTIWQRQNTGTSFKFVVDAGVSMTPGVVPAAYLYTPVVKEAISRKGKEKRPQYSVHTDTMEQTEAFRNMAARESLGQALKSYLHEKSFLLLSDYGKPPLKKLANVKPLGGRFRFQRTSLKNLSAGCYYEWGQFRSADSGENYSGYYVHVWRGQERKPLLLAAVYKFDQTLKP